MQLPLTSSPLAVLLLWRQHQLQQGFSRIQKKLRYCRCKPTPLLLPRLSMQQQKRLLLLSKGSWRSATLKGQLRQKQQQSRTPWNREGGVAVLLLWQQCRLQQGFSKTQGVLHCCGCGRTLLLCCRRGFQCSSSSSRRSFWCFQGQVGAALLWTGGRGGSSRRGDDGGED